MPTEIGGQSGVSFCNRVQHHGGLDEQHDRWFAPFDDRHRANDGVRQSDPIVVGWIGDSEYPGDSYFDKPYAAGFWHSFNDVTDADVEP